MLYSSRKHYLGIIIESAARVRKYDRPRVLGCIVSSCPGLHCKTVLFNLCQRVQVCWKHYCLIISSVLAQFFFIALLGLNVSRKMGN